jgi:hypothetical protein
MSRDPRRRGARPGRGAPRRGKTAGRRPTTTHSEQPGGSRTAFVFKVALKGAGGVWRRIAVHGDQTLHHLHAAIFQAFDREEEHLYSFYFPKPGARSRDRLRTAVEYTHPFNARQDPFGERVPDASRTKLARLELQVGRTFDYLFDFGDGWWHEITVEGLDDAGGRYPRILEQRGESPPQYPDPDF